ncbi:DUF1517 domain-containing protein [Phormidesmis priestleyi]|nr:DUF1517 domain-containing protein [Phormidesmis priestleyi]
MPTRTFKLFCATVMSCGLLSSVSLPIATLQGKKLDLGNAAYAKSSGGRSSGGSFRSSPSRSSGSSRNNSSGGYNSGGGAVFIPYGGSSYGYGSSAIGGFGLLLVMLLVLGGGGLVVWLLLSARKGIGSTSELDNDKVTVTKLQVALLAEGRAIQSQLSEIVQNADTETSQGLQQELQEVVLALLRMPENWSHVLASSQTVKTREEAETLFSQNSIAERSNFSVETLTNVGGRVNTKTFTPDPEEDPASYIVVTLIVGTADDKPLLSEVRTTEALKAALEKLASINPDYLMVFELLWSPQDKGDSLTYDELLTEYSGMMQI